MALLRGSTTHWSMSHSAGKAGSMHLAGGVLSSDQGGAVLRGVPAGLTARQFDGQFDGLVLGASSDQPTSRHNTRLGKVCRMWRRTCSSELPKQLQIMQAEQWQTSVEKAGWVSVMQLECTRFLTASRIKLWWAYVCILAYILQARAASARSKSHLVCDSRRMGAAGGWCLAGAARGVTSHRRRSSCSWNSSTAGRMPSCCR